MIEHEIEFRREELTSPVAERLILALNEEILRRYPEEGTPLHFRLEAAEVAEGRGTFLVAYHHGRPVGCGAVRLLDSARAEIKRMYIEPSARGHGLGYRLLCALEAEALMLEVKEIVLETGPRQPEAIALYSRAGFSRIAAFGEHHDHPLSVFMGKTLQS